MKSRGWRTLFAVAGLSALCAPIGCQAANPAHAPVERDVEELKAAYYNVLEFEKCVDRAPDAKDRALLNERRRTTGLIQRARSKSLQRYLDEAEAKWRRIDSLADKICYFQTNDFKGTSARLLRNINDRFESVIGRF